MADEWGDVLYLVWLNGGNPDAIDDECVRIELADGYEADSIAARELHKQKQKGRAADV